MTRSTQPAPPSPATAPGRFAASLAASSGIHGGLLAAAVLAGAWWSVERALEPRPAQRVRSVVLAAPPALEAEPPETLVLAQPVPPEEEPVLVERGVLPGPPPDLFDTPALAEIAFVPPATWDELDWAVEERPADLPAADPAADPGADPGADPAEEPLPEELAQPVADEPAVATPVLVEAPPPRYPRLSVRAGEEGTVRCRIAIAPDGTVTSVTVETSSGFRRLDEAALAALRAWRFVPRSEDGVAVAAEIVHPVTFVLDAR
jgi:protein TonB